MNTPKDLLTRKQAALQIGVTMQSIDDYIRKGWLKGWKFGRLVRVEGKSVTEFLKGRPM